MLSGYPDPMEPFEIREVLPAEREAAGRLVVTAYRSIGLDVGGYEAEIADVAGRLAHGTVLVAIADGRLAGCATLAPAGSPLCEVEDPEGWAIRMFGVDPAMRGRGLGRALIDACIGRARAGGGARLWLHTEPEMVAAGRLYARSGFGPAPEHDLHFVHEGRPMVLHAYVLQLRPT